MLKHALRVMQVFRPKLLHCVPLQTLSIRGPLFTSIPVSYFSTTLPKHKKLEMPALSPTMETGNIQKYLKKVGDPITAGDVLCEVETDKATVGFEMQDEGFLAQILVPEGSKGVKVGQLVAVIVPKQSDVASFANYKDSSSQQCSAASKPAAQPQQSSTPQRAQPAATGGAFPKHSKLGLPALSPTMEKGNLMKWLVKEGDRISPGDVICEIETDKATVGFEVQEDGYIAKLMVPAGSKDIKLGTILAISTPKKDNVPSFTNYTLEGAAAAAQTTQAQPPQQQQQQQQTITNETPVQTVSQSGQRIFASPLAKEFAKINNVPLEYVKGTGIDGSIVKKDVERFLSSGSKPEVQQQQQVITPPQQQQTQAPSQEQPAQQTPPPAQAKQQTKPAAASKPVAIEGNPYVDTELTNMRLTIAARLLESKTTIPHYYLTMTVTMDKVLKVREELNKLQKVKISVNDFIIKASALALKDVPQANSQWHGTYIRKFANADISIAVATDAGLITPIVFNAGSKGLGTIASTVKELADKAKANKLKPQEFIGGTFTISNLGMFGIDQFIAVINPPQSAILAVGKTSKRFVPDEHGQPKVESQMDVTLSCDHRVVDGAVGAQWLQRFKYYIEDPNTLLL
ncbi:unnamed protein product (macronuclear) [Paramecium tetraurelia]|uniref:Dihydrolipoamide acetyltransferase component of pyruvate dehydrogenase complex n=1 Tax=Paramecium tetraurelia TaxID=5888 RepID=A0CWR1_PARTE|nr:uncharacterized protein GSPATT00001431001 [Paramecium tetraurelia]CAK75228.1 unnamed protein product [Paramecium tetraurelia]|eukprot:XP_001442625.1 hypothetical protein (macronuclear) [Paramecium tetraurelia strain d4-2]